MRFERNGNIQNGQSNINATEGSASISDLAGNLLFYTDGNTVYTADHGLMTNGSNISGAVQFSDPTQSAIIIPNPKYKHLFYIFTSDVNNGSGGFRFSEVDMTKGNGMGEVTSNKSILLLSNAAEKITAIRTTDGTGVWVITHGMNNTFYSFLVNEYGVVRTPVTSSAGTSISTMDIGQMKGSPDGNYIAMAAAISGKFVEVFDFNASNGEVGANTVIKVNYGSHLPYGVEFSSDAKKLYISGRNTAGQNASIFQYDMDMVVNEVLFRDSEVTIASNVKTRSLQLGQDGKIYGARNVTTSIAIPSLDVIHSPKLTGSNCNFQEGGYILLNGTGSKLGLPNFMVNYFIERKIEVQDSCIGDSTAFVYLLEIPDSVHWDFDDPNSGTENNSNLLRPKHQFTSAGQYNVVLFVYNGNEVDTFTKTLNIHNLPSFTLGADTAVCIGQTLWLRPGVFQANYRWQDGRTLPAFPAITSGLYHVSVEKFGCIAYDSINVTVSDPRAEIKLDRLDPCENENRLEMQVKTNGPVQSLLWKTGDNQEYTSGKLIHHYTSAGTYTVEVELINDYGCIARDNQTVQINPVAKANMVVNNDEQCITGNQFIYQASITQGWNVLQQYTINGATAGATSSNANLTESFSLPGTYQAQIITRTVHGCMDTGYRAIKVLENPEPNFTIDVKDDCEATNLVLLASQGSSVNGTIQQSTFEAGDGRVFSGSQMGIRYSAVGTYTLTHKVTDIKGCEASDTKTIEINPSPVADFTTGSSSNCIGTDPVQFSNASTLSAGQITAFNWKFGDGMESQLENPQHQYADAAKYNVKLVVTSDKGCSSQKSIDFFTYEVPKADFTIDALSYCFNENRMSFVNTSSIKGQDQLSYTWELDAQTFYTDSVNDYKFGTAGVKEIKLQVRSDKGCVSNVYKTIVIKESPEALMSVNNPVQCAASNLFIARNQSIDQFVSSSWKLSDGRIFTGNEIQFSTTQAGLFTLELTIVNSESCPAKAISMVEVAPMPTADFTAEDVCLNQATEFVNISAVDNGVIEKIHWDFGDNSKEINVFSPSHTYTEPGVYPVFLSVESEAGCKSYLVKSVKVKDIPKASFDITKYKYENEKTVFQFTELKQQPHMTYDWYINKDFGGSGPSFFFGFSDTGWHEAELVVTNTEGCTATQTKSFFVMPPFEMRFPTAFTPNGDGLNDFFGPIDVSFTTEFEMVILNKWGIEVYRTKETVGQWDGKFKGVPAMNDYYVYLVKAKDLEGVDHHFEGGFMLIR
ncbi:MAG: PKD domain-containing protein [Bacteroidetes bacterium]|nr:MAG: PKD domain-containing protein [Bacteroidota bacterium]